MSYVDDMIASRREAMEESMELTPEVVTDLKDAMLECTMNVLYNRDEETYIMVSEGANIEMTKAFKARMKEFKVGISSYTKALKAKDYSAAKTALGKANEAVVSLESDIKGLDFTVGSAIFGLFADSFVNSIQMLIPNIVSSLVSKKYMDVSFANMEDITDRMMDMDLDYESVNGVFKGMMTAASGAGNAEVKKAYTKLQIVSVFNWIISLVKSIREIRGIYKRYKAGDSSKEALNMYRNKMLMICSDLKKLVSALEKSLNKKMDGAN